MIRHSFEKALSLVLTLAAAIPLRAELPSEYVELESIPVPRGVSLDVSAEPSEATKVYVDVVVGDNQRKMMNVETRLVSFDKIARCYGVRVADSLHYYSTQRLQPCIEISSGNFGLYDVEKKVGESEDAFFPLVRPVDEMSQIVVDDPETLNSVYIDPGQVLKHNHRYHVTEDRSVDATSMSGVSALRVPRGAAVIIDIAEGKTLTVKGGPGFGRLPGGAGIEVPNGAKLVVTGGKGSKLVVQGGAAAAGGKGYGGMGGQFSFFQVSGELDPKHWPYDDFDPGSYSDITNNNVAASSFAKDPLYFGLTGDGGDGGDGGGGAGAGIGTRGGSGGLGGKGPKATFVTGGKFYEGNEERYDKYAQFFDLDKNEWHFYNSESASPHNGSDGFAGGDGQSPTTCGEIIIIGDVVVEAMAGAAGAGGENGPFGSSAQVNEDPSTGYSGVMDTLNFFSTGTGLVGTIFSFSKNKTLQALSTAFGPVSAGLAVMSFIDQVASGDDKTMRNQLWFTGGGGGGGGAGGTSGFGIGAGGAGGGAGGAGGEGFFVLGNKSVYTYTDSWLSTRIDATTPPLQVSGHGGKGGVGAARGKDATSEHRGEADAHPKEDGDTYNYFCTPRGDWGLGADSWWDGAVAYSGRGGAGGNQAGVNTNQFTFLCSDINKVSGSYVVSPETITNGKPCYTVIYDPCNGNPNQVGEFICGTIVEQAPSVAGTSSELTFAGYYTQPDGQGVQYFDCYHNPVGSPKATEDLHLYAHWVKDGELPKGFTRIVNGSTLNPGDILWNGNIYYFDTSRDFVNTNFAAGLNLQTGGTAVIYIEKDVTVTCTGSKANGLLESYPGIYVPANSTLIVTGEGKLVATGGPASNGWNGYPGYSYANPDANQGTSRGGAGGFGGNGGGAGIGGKSGIGAEKGKCETQSYYWRYSGWGCDGSSGGSGSDGGDGEACGNVYLLGHVTVNAHGGAAGKGGSAGKSDPDSHAEGKSYWLNVGSSGGGGGGAGGAAGHAIGGGGAGGGGGGAGGGGTIIWDGNKNFYAQGGVGGGGLAADPSGNGSPDHATGGGWTEDYSGKYVGGNGGAGGNAGKYGDDGKLYINEAVVLNDEVLAERSQWEYSFGHPALGRTITIKRDGRDPYPLQAMIGCPLPILADSDIRPYPGVVLKGGYVVTKGGETNWWYGAEGVPEVEQYKGLDDVTLNLVYEFDTERMAGSPEDFSFRYDGESHIAFKAENLPGCTYLCGVTNATETGFYSYSVRLDDDYTIWSDLTTNRVKTIGWEVTRGVITNEWKNNVITYDWTKTREANINAITNNPARTFGFKLPEDAKISFELGEQTQVNEQRLIVKITGMKNYFDKTYYGVFSCEQPFQLKLRNHYPWATKLDILTMLSSVEIEEKDMEKFKQAYGNAKILASIYVPDGEGGTREVCLNKDTAATVYDALNSGSGAACVTVNLKSIPELAGVRAFSLPVYVSLDGQIFQGGSVSVDTTADESAGYPVYAIDDVADIFNIASSTTFLDDETHGTGPREDHTLLAIGTPDEPGRPFVPRTASGEQITDDKVRWKPTSAGEYKLEHWVVDREERERLGYRCAYINFTDEYPETGRNDLVRVKIEHKVSGETKGYTSLAAAVDDLRYGDTLVIVQDVQMERVKIPSGTLVRVEGDGVFRSPRDGDFTSDYVAADTVINENGKLESAAYHLDEAKVQPVIIGTQVVNDGETRTFEMTVDNVKGNLFYLLKGSTDLKAWSLCEKIFANGATETADFSTPTTNAQGFFKLAVTDEPTPLFTIRPYYGGVAITGSDSFTAGAPFAGRLVIPATLEGKKVTGVFDYGFQNRADIISVDIAEGVDTLERGAFMNCTNLKSVSLPESLRRIYSDVFVNTAIEELVVPKNVYHIDYNYLPGLKVLRFLGSKPSGWLELSLSSDCVVYVPRDAGWTGVPAANWHGARLEHWVDFTIERDDEGRFVIAKCGTIPPDGRLWVPAERDGKKISAIKYEAFLDRTDIKKLVVAEGVSDIGGGAFLGCTNLTEVELPKSLTHLGRNVFGNATTKSNITSITFLGDAPTYDADIGLNADKCTIHVSAGAEGWGETWQGCPVKRDLKFVKQD